ncbi:amino acid permease [bacterium]|nr:amino acid permease [bacterium]
MTLSESSNAEPTANTLPRVLTLWDGVGIVIGSIIGSGIFLKVGNVDAALKMFGFGPIIGIWALVGLVTLCGSLALGELAAMFPHAGGPYVYLREAYGRLPAFLWGWTEFWVVRTGSVGALACATALYLNQVVPLSHWGQGGVAIAIVVGLSSACVISTRWSASIQNSFTVIKLLFLGAIIVLPVLMFRSDVTHWSPVWEPSTETSFWQALGVAFIAVMWPYDGWINLAPVAEDLREPHRNVPKALAIGMGVVVTVYVLANLSYHLVLTMEQVAGTKTIAADMFQVLFGPTGAKLAAIGVMCSTFGATNSNMLCGPRIYFAMARDGLLPGSLQQVHTRWQTPANAIIVQCVWTVILILVFYAWKSDPKAAFDGLTDSVIFAGLIFYSLTVGAVYVLRRSHPQQERPYRTWGYPLTPALLIGVYLFALVRQLIDQWQQMTAVIALIISGVIYYAIMTRGHRKPAPIR